MKASILFGLLCILNTVHGIPFERTTVVAPQLMTPSQPLFSSKYYLPQPAAFLPLIKQKDPIVPGKYFDRIITIMFENTNIEDALKDPYFASLYTQGLGLNKMHGVTHPSQPNYITQIYGDDPWLQYPKLHLDKPVDIDGINLVDLLEAKAVSWKAYQQNHPAPGTCFPGDSIDGLYRRKHNPFISMTTVSSDAERCKNIVDFAALEADVRDGKVPQYVYITPNMNNDGHDTNTPYASYFLEGFLKPYLNNPEFLSPRTLLIVTFDESESYVNSNTVYAALLGQVVRKQLPGAEKDYNHYSILKTVEENWNLGDLGRKDVDAASMADVFI